jgi:hypothetical protein
MAQTTLATDPGYLLERLVREQRIKLEITGGVPTWRLLPGVRHQKVIDRIRATMFWLPGGRKRADGIISRTFR